MNFISINNLNVLFLFMLISLISLIEFSTCSTGDNLLHYKRCKIRCLETNCSNPHAIQQFQQNQPYYLQLLAWDCHEECKYQCQWNTINHLVKSKVPLNKIPQFYGKVIVIVNNFIKLEFVDLVDFQKNHGSPRTSFSNIFNFESMHEFLWMEAVHYFGSN